MYSVKVFFWLIFWTLEIVLICPSAILSITKIDSFRLLLSYNKVAGVFFLEVDVNVFYLSGLQALSF